MVSDSALSSDSGNPGDAPPPKIDQGEGGAPYYPPPPKYAPELKGKPFASYYAFFEFKKKIYLIFLLPFYDRFSELQWRKSFG